MLKVLSPSSVWAAAPRRGAAIALIAAAALAGGCSASQSQVRSSSLQAQTGEDRPPPERRPGPAQPPETPMPHPPRTLQESDEGDAVRAAAERELGPEAAASMPEVEAAPLEPVDAGAAQIVGAVASGLPQRAAGEGGVTIVSVHEVRNLSRTDTAEFERLLDRFAGLLTRAGAEARLEFTRDAGRTAHYRMQGTAYLITAGGFDQWEMYLSIAPSHHDFTVWDARAPVRVVRHARPNQPQVLSIGN